MTEAAQAEEHDIYAHDGEPEVEAQPEEQQEEVVEDSQADPAPAQEESVDTPAEPDGVQKRINKITADKYEEKRRADALQQRLDALEQQQQAPPQQPSTAVPTLEQFDFDDAKYQAALIDHKVDQRFAQQQVQQTQAQETTRVTAINNSFNAQVADFTAKKPDYQEVIGNVPTLPAQTLETVMTMPNGAEVAYFLGQHLDVADEIATASPIMAAMRLGEIRAQLANGKPKPKPSAAPDPIAPISAGGKIASKRGPKGATFE
jgi:hypothetical protein